tara:strand:+ start:36 stop:479 length:444 start_codon:yes stop_codon:yes gene_type:complete
MPKILTLNGPNLNLLGTREPDQYGSDTLEIINKRLEEIAISHKCEFEHHQTNSEACLVELIHKAQYDTNFIIINPAALTHTSVALRDALLGVDIPFIEVHLSNIHSRENFRKNSFLSDVAMGVITGFGSQSYDMAMENACIFLKTNR